MKQQCYLWSVWLTWIGLPMLIIVSGITQGVVVAALILIVGVLGQVLYIRVFPRVSRWLGYGSVEDVAVEPPPQSRTASPVTLYTANVCPFCPIVRRRIQELQHKLGFDLNEVDVTFQPRLVREKGIRSVPVIEMNGRYWVGNATSAQLLTFFTAPE